MSYNESIIYYSKNPFNKFKMKDFSVNYFEENDLCGDNLTIFLKIKDNIIENWSFSGDTAIITTACASLLGETIIGTNLKKCLDWDYNYIEELLGEKVSDRRKKASVLALLTTRNAVHKYLKDGKKDIFENLI